MKYPIKQLLALVLVLVLAVPVLALSEDEGELILPSGQEILPEAQDDLELDPEALDGLEGLDDLGPDLGVNEGIELSEDLLALDGPGEAAGTDPEDLSLADNAGETVRVKYIDAKGRPQEPVECVKMIPGNENRNMGDGWYAVTEKLAYSEGIIVYGNANLILCNDMTLTVDGGIWVQRNASLTVWGQSTGEDMGMVLAYGDEGKAGVGGIEGEVAGPIIINGGWVWAKGGSDGAGIGGGEGKNSGFTRIEINGGTASGFAKDNSSDAAGIGRGENNRNIGDVIINGGKIGTRGGGGCAGIYGNIVTINDAENVSTSGYRGGPGIFGGLVTINGGTVHAKGARDDSDVGGAGIGNCKDELMEGALVINGGYVEATGSEGGAGIGGGSNTSNEDCRFDVTITGGTVIANGGGIISSGGAGIGGGMENGDMVGNVTITGGTVVARGIKGGAGIGGGNGGNADCMVIITGGKVTAVGGKKAAGIGGGVEGSFRKGGKGADVRIGNYAEVIAIAGGKEDDDHCSAIGHGHDDGDMGTVRLGANMMVKAGWSEAEAEKSAPIPSDLREGHCMYRWYAHILPCVHTGATCSNITEKTHTVNACSYCKVSGRKEAHVFEPKTRSCTVCGYRQEAPIPTAQPTPMPTPTTVPIITIRPTTRPTATPKPTEKPQAAQRDYTLLARLKNVGSKGTSLQLVWTKVSGADGYDVYFARCGERYSLYQTVPARTRSLTIDGLNRQSNYKARVVAWKRVKGARKTIGAASPTVHANAGRNNKKTTNARSITLKKSSVTLKPGATLAIKASAKGMKSGVKLLAHARLLRYFSSNRNVATVSASGTITATGRGRCAIYVMANNGLRVKVTVTVK